MITKPQYDNWKQKEIERLEIEAEACERQLEAIQVRLMRLEEETYSEAIADDRSAEWRARQIELENLDGAN